jgi:hypothetical protein
MTNNDLIVLASFGIGRDVSMYMEPLAYKMACDKLEADNLITLNDHKREYEITPRGAAHLRQVRNLTLPSAVWVDSQGNIIKAVGA